MRHILIYDGTYEGFFSAVFKIYQEKLEEVLITRKNAHLLFTHSEIIETCTQHAARVYNAFRKKISKTSLNNFSASFLSELGGIENSMFDFMQYVFSNKSPVDTNFANEHILRITQVSKMVNREKHRMEAFTRFQLTNDAIYFATIEPDFNVLPLIASHFTRRYADQKWIIYDVKRKFGLYYDLSRTEIVEIDFSDFAGDENTAKEIFDPSEEQYKQLWKIYFKNVNIPSRRNMRLHLRHVPRRYWKYLTEKQ